MRFLPFFLFFILFFTFTHAQEVPAPQGYVLDSADLLTSEQESLLESRLASIEQSTSVEIAVFIFPSLEGGDMFEYSQRVFDTWKIGQEENDNGLLVAISSQDREWRIHTGYGLEGVLPDGLARQIGNNKMVPLLAEGEYYGGISAALDDMEGILANNPEVVAAYEASPIEFELFNSGFLIGGVALLLLVALLHKMWNQISPEKRRAVLAKNVFAIIAMSIGLSGAGSILLLLAFNGFYPFTLLSLTYAYWLVFTRFPLEMKFHPSNGRMGTGGWGVGRGSGGFGGGGFGGGMSGGGGAGGKF